MRLTRLPEESYTRAVFITRLGHRLLPSSPLSVLALLAVVAAGLVAVRSRALRAGWDSLESATTLRAIVGLSACLLAWTFATYPYNAYFDQPHHLERALLLVLAALVVWRPVFAYAFLPALLSVGWQFHHPISGYSWAAPILLVRVLILFGAFWVLRAVTRHMRIADFLFLLFCLVCAHYWSSGLGKLRLGWPVDDTVAWLLPATYTNGWLGFLPPEKISAITRTLVGLNWPMKLATLLVECGALLALRARPMLRALLAGAIALHAAIFLLTGIFFWMWMLLDALLIGVVLRRDGPASGIFTRSHFLLSIALIGPGDFWFRPVRLAWLDSPASYTYRLAAEDSSGRSHDLPPAFFAPYDYQFTLSAFRYLVSDRRLPVTWGAAPRNVVRALERTKDPQSVFAAEDRIGRSSFDPARAEAFDTFVSRFVDRRTERGSAFDWWRILPAPPLVWTFPLRPPSPPDPVDRVVVREVTSLFDGERYIQIRRTEVRVINVRQRQHPARDR